MSGGRPFEPGNKFGRGRPKGSRNKLNPVEQFLKEYQSAILKKGVGAALRDNTKVLLWCLEKLSRMGQSFQKLKLPPIKTLDDVGQALGLVVNAIANRTCSAADGQVLVTALEKCQQLIETQDLVARVEEVERQIRLGNK